MYVINIQEHKLSHNGDQIALSPKPFSMLVHFVTNPGRLLTTNQILDNVWPETVVTPDSVKDYVAVIRRALNESASNPVHIETVRGVGYRYIGNIAIEGSISERGTGKLDQASFRSIPADLTRFSGRENELNHLCNIIKGNSCRVVSLQGPSGIGKTRLAFALANKLAELRYKHNEPVYYCIAAISLASVQPHAERILQAIAAALEISLHQHQPHLEQIKNHLAGKPAVLLLDNTEHLSEKIGVCLDLLQQLPLLKLVVTSCKPTRLYGEWVYLVPGLSLVQNKTFDSIDAIEFFIESVSRASPGTNCSSENIAVITEICNRLNGIPLAIEMCAQWSQKLSFAEILHAMKNNSAVMEHTSVIAGYGDISIAWVMNQQWLALTEYERTAFAALSLFSSEFSLEAALFVTESTPSVIGNLVANFMLVKHTDNRFALHPGMREYARARLGRLDSGNHFTARYIEYYVAFAEKANKKIFSREQFALIQALELEHQNLRAAMQFCKEKNNLAVDGNVLGLRLVGGLCMFWFLANHWSEGEEWSRYFINHNSKDSSHIAGALLTLGGLAALNDNLEEAETSMEWAVRAASLHGPAFLYGRTLSGFGLVRRLQGRFDEAIILCEQSLVVFRELEDDGSSLVSIGCIGQSYIDSGEYQMAVESFTQSVRMSQLVGNTFNLPHAVVNLARSHLALGQNCVAVKCLQQYLPMLNEMGFLLYIAQALNICGWLEVSKNTTTKALEHFSCAADHYLQLGDRTGLAESLEGIAAASCENEDYILAQKYLFAVELQCEEIVYETPVECRQIVKRVKQKLQKELSVEQRVLAKRIGQSMTPELLLSLLKAEHKLQRKTSIGRCDKREVH